MTTPHWSRRGRYSARRLARQLRRLRRCGRATAVSSGVKEWSDLQLARLRPPWLQAFQRAHAIRCAFLAVLYLLALAFLGASLERFWYWARANEAVASAPVRTVDQWRAHCVVKPWSSGCESTRRADRGTGVRLSPTKHAPPKRATLSGAL